MSTHPLERRRVRPVGRRADLRRVAMWCAAIAGVFAIAFGIGHIRRGGETIVERTPPRLPAVASPVPGALATAPAIKLAVVRRPPPAPKQSAPAKSAQPAAAPTVTPAVTPTTSSPAPAPSVTPAPAPVTPAPAPRSSGGGSSGGGSSGGGSSGGGSGTSFESSG